MSDFDPDTERATEVEDYTGETPRGPAPEGRDPADAAGFGDGDIADVSDLDSDLSALAEEIDVLAVLAERDQFKDLAIRVQADFENYRKRATAQTAAEAERATARLAEALLPVLDATEAAYVAHPDQIGPLLNLLLAELKKQGLEMVDIIDQPFDPELAEAVAHQPGTGGDVVVAEVLRTGYTWQGRTLRAAMVRTTD